MKKIGLFILLCLFSLQAYSAEFLVKAKPHWKDSWSAEKVKSLTIKEKEEYDARSQIGDIIVVKPNGANYGKREKPPWYVVIKIPDMPYKEAKKYEDKLIEDLGEGNFKLLKKRKYQLDTLVVDQAKLEISGTKTLNKTTAISKIETKTAVVVTP